MEILFRQEESILPSTNIKNTTDCVVCFEVPKQYAVYQCDRGHILCDTCHENVFECPMCRIQLKRPRHLLVEAGLVRFPRPAYLMNDGCRVTLKTTKITEYHNTSKYIPVPCVHPGCQGMVPMTELAAHIDDKHEIKCHFKTKQFTIVYKHMKTSICIERQFGPCRLTFDGFHFFSSVWRHFSPKKRWFIWLYIVGTTDESKNYVYTVKLTGPEFNEVITYTGQTISVQTGREQICSKYRCLTFDDEMAKRLCSTNRLKIMFNLDTNGSS